MLFVITALKMYIHIQRIWNKNMYHTRKTVKKKINGWVVGSGTRRATWMMEICWENNEKEFEFSITRIYI